MLERLWQLTELQFRPDEQHHHETLFTIGNGYLGTRGAFEEGYPGETPATLVHGIYNHAPDTLVPELVNAPNWLVLKIWVDGTPFGIVQSTENHMRPPQGVIFGYERTLDMRRALLRREALFRAQSGAIVRVQFERFASLADVHVMAQRVRVTAVEGNPTIEVESVIDADVSNQGVRHWRSDATTIADGDTTGVEVTTAQSNYVLGMASRLLCDGAVESIDDERRPASRTRFSLSREQTATLTKLTTVYTSRDVPNSPLEAARAKLDEATELGWDLLFSAHEAEWAEYWDTADIQISGDDEVQRALRFTTYHYLIAAPRFDERVSIGAKTLSGLGYKGHVFWDTELFIVPPLVLSQPQLARNLLMYRYHNLPGARNKARANGYEGAMYPWESTDTGEETTPQWSDPGADGTRIRIWTGDNEQHISTDIAYAVWLYWRWTGDDEFLRRYGAEIILDTAVFWGSRVEKAGDRYEISQQIGPDEYHENVDNSVFVNRMVVWHLETALWLVDYLYQHAPDDARRLVDTLDLTPDRLTHWRDVADKMYIPFDEERQIHVQFPGFFDLEYVPVPDYTPRTTSLHAILGHHRIAQTQVIKQADVVMLMALLGDELGPREVLLNNWHTYYPRTDHGSSLSPAVHAWVAAWLGLTDVAYEMLYHAVHIDLHDNKGNVGQGIHAAACGGVWQAVVFGFCGLQIENGELKTQPNLPKHWTEVSFRVYYQGQLREFTVRNPEAVPLSQ